MSGRLAVAILLAVFVAAAIVFLILQGAGSANEASETVNAPGSGERVAMFYFHATRRCTTCRMIEETSLALLEKRYSDEMASGRLVWAPVNVDLPENERYYKRFEMPNRTLVLAELDGDVVRRFQRLDRVWELSKDRERLVEYITDETQRFLGEAG